MKIVADEKIPLIQYYFGNYGDLLLKNGREIIATDLIDADILIVRSITKVNKELLKNSSVRFVGSVSTGDDHLDLQWLDASNIPYYIAYGCNARPVVEYVVAIMAAHQALTNKTAGVVGVGRIGSQVVDILRQFGWTVLQCDPVRAEREPDFEHTPLEQLTQVDLLTCHTPLTHDGLHPTFHLLNQDFLSRMKTNAFILNTGRGAVIDFNAVKKLMDQCIWCFDVWENEPNIDREILGATHIATPHIAGHSIQAKYRAIQMVHDACVQRGILSQAVSQITYPQITIDCAGQKVTWREMVLKIFDPIQMTKKMKMVLHENSQQFDFLRNQFSKHEFEFVTLENAILTMEDKKILQELNFAI